MQTWIERLHRTLLGTAVAWWRTQVHHAAVLRPRLILVPIDALAACRITFAMFSNTASTCRVSPGHGTDFHHGADFRTSCVWVR
jgi:hypothetical protein